MSGNVFIGSTVIGWLGRASSIRVMHISRGLPLISAEHEPHLPALQFQRHARSGACVGLDLVHRVEHDHPLGHFGLVLGEFAGRSLSTPDLEGRVRHVVRRLLGFRGN